MVKRLLTAFAVVSVLATAGIEVSQQFNQLSEAATRILLVRLKVTSEVIDMSVFQHGLVKLVIKINK